MKLTHSCLCTLILSGTCLTVAACGGKSDSNDDGGSDTTHTGGALSGAGGTGGTVTAGGEGGVEVGGAASGGRQTAGEANGGAPEAGGAASGGQETAGEANGGLPATAGAGEGGQEPTAGGSEAGGAAPGGSSSGGAANGGAEQGGSVAAGGAGGATTLPDTPCAAMCEREVAAGCSATGTLADCVMGCNLMAGIEACSAEVNAMMTCAQEATVSCDDAGEVVFEGCEVTQLAILACLQAAPPPAELEAPCAAYCDARAEVACPSDDPETCLSECGMVGNIAPTCTEGWASYLDCAATDELVCDDSGEASPSGCTVESLTALSCIMTSVAGA